VKSTGTEELRTESVKRSSLLYHGRWGPPPAARRRKADFLRWLDGSFEGGGNSTSGRALWKRSRRGGAPGGAVGGVRGRGGDVLLENFDFFFHQKVSPTVAAILFTDVVGKLWRQPYHPYQV
jgi:hypothetical protein